jgi:diguanylate cyclase (GGDEF)-like protein/PAS domain S-box-containing protein
MRPGLEAGGRFRTGEMEAQGKILIVDDNRESSDALAQTLSRLEFEVETAMTGMEGLRAAEQERHDLVLLDVALPDMSGLEVLSSIRSGRDMADLPIIMLTSVARDEIVVEALSRGANDFVVRPAQPSVMNSRIRTQISLSRAEKALKLSEERYALAAAATRDGLWDWKLRDEQLFISANWSTIAALPGKRESIRFDEWIELVHDADRSDFYSLMNQLRKGHRDRLDLECRIRQPDGSLRWVAVRGILVRDPGGEPQRIAGALSDVTDSKFYHSLTGLPALPLLQERIERLIHSRAAGAKSLGALLFIDLDGFRFLNQAYGHANGDLIIMTVAERIMAMLGPSDILAHYGRDEFLAFLEGACDPSKILDRVGALLERIQAPIATEEGGAEMSATACAGVAILDASYSSATKAVQDAESAMHMAKRDGPNRYRFFLKDYYDRVKERLERDRDLRTALKETQFMLVYQPQIRIADGSLAGFEALLRRREPGGSIIMPDALIPLAEENGMIGKLGEWILRTACTQIKLWTDEGLRPPRVAVNLSPLQFNDEGLASSLMSIIASTGADPSLLELEITESKAMENPEETIRIMAKLKGLGLTFAIDDFGTGYSSLSMLQRFPLSTLKIDKAFISGIGDSESARSIVEAIIALARSMRFSTIAEGVERLDQLEFLMGSGCDAYQGYYMSAPVSAEEAGEFLRKHGRASAGP